MTAARLPVVGVLGSGSVAHEERARALGRWLACQGVHLLTGGGTQSNAAALGAGAWLINETGATPTDAESWGSVKSLFR